MAFATAYEGQQRLGRVLARIEQCLHRVAHGLRQTRATEREVVAISVDVTPDVLALHDVLFETMDRGEQRVPLLRGKDEGRFQEIGERLIGEVFFERLEPAFQRRGRGGGGQGPARSVVQSDVGALEQRAQAPRRAAGGRGGAGAGAARGRPAPRRGGDGARRGGGAGGARETRARGGR